MKAVELIKWPALVVRGKPVLEEQAAEICLRTCGRYISSNDRPFLKEVYRILEIPQDDHDQFKNAADWASFRAKEDAAWNRWKVLDVEYLTNHQICTSWVGGPDHGWLRWNGEVHNSEGLNIGKWPSVEEVEREWELIASEWPFLELTCQLWNCEAWFPPETEDPKPVVQFNVKDGKCTVGLPKRPIAWPSNSQLNFGKRENNISLSDLEKVVSIHWSSKRRS